jgi:predicted kinase
MKISVTILSLIGFFLIHLKHEVEVIYLDQLQTHIAQFTYFKQSKKNLLDRTELILKEAEEILIERAKDHIFEIIEIFIID